MRTLTSTVSQLLPLAFAPSYHAAPVPLCSLCICAGVRWGASSLAVKELGSCDLYPQVGAGCMVCHHMVCKKWWLWLLGIWSRCALNVVVLPEWCSHHCVRELVDFPLDVREHCGGEVGLAAGQPQHHFGAQ